MSKPAADRQSRAARATGYLPGLALAAALAVASRFAPNLVLVPSVMAALALGLLLSPLVGKEPFRPGLDVAARQVLRLGVVLLGAQITFQQVADLGAGPFALAVGTVILSLGLGYAVARRFRLSPELSWLTSGAVAICGASAALAIAAVLPRSSKSDEDAAATVGGITVIGTAAMLLYPLLTAALNFNATSAGIFLGASLHEVVQAVGAGFAVSSEAGEVATTVKLVRVACLGPVVLLIIWWTRKAGREDESSTPTLIPAFLLGFIALAAIASIGAIPAAMLPILAEASRFCLLAAIAALGTKVSIRKLIAFGPTAALALLAQTLVIGGLALLGTVLLSTRV